MYSSCLVYDEGLWQYLEKDVIHRKQPANQS